MSSLRRYFLLLLVVLSYMIGSSITLAVLTTSLDFWLQKSVSNLTKNKKKQINSSVVSSLSIPGVGPHMPRCTAPSLWSLLCKVYECNSPPYTHTCTLCLEITHSVTHLFCVAGLGQSKTSSNRAEEIGHYVIILTS